MSLNRKVTVPRGWPVPARSGRSVIEREAPRVPRGGSVEHDRASSPQLEHAALLEIAERPVDGRSRRTSQLGEVVLRKRHLDQTRTVGVQLGQLAQPAQHAPIGRDEQRLEEAIVEHAHLAYQEGGERVVDGGMEAAQSLELVSVDGERLGGFERDHRCRAGGTGVDERHLAEVVSRSRTASMTASPRPFRTRIAKRPRATR